MINDRDPLWDSALWKFDTFNLYFPLDYYVPEVPYQAQHIHIKSTNLVVRDLTPHIGRTMYSDVIKVNINKVLQ
jgi:hypothetical protein